MAPAARPTLRPSFLRWSYDFWRSTSRRRYSAGMAALVALGGRALAAYDALRDTGVTFEMHADGLLFVAHSEEELDAETCAFHRIDVAVLDHRHGGDELVIPASVEGAHRLLDQMQGRTTVAEEGRARAEHYGCQMKSELVGQTPK